MLCYMNCRLDYIIYYGAIKILKTYSIYQLIDRFIVDILNYMRIKNKSNKNTDIE